MTDPLSPTSDQSDPPPPLDQLPSAPAGKMRFFTPGNDPRESVAGDFRRFGGSSRADRESGTIEEWAGASSEPSVRPVSPGPMRFQPNKAIELLEAVHEHHNPDRLEQRMSRLVVGSLVALLASIVLFVLGSIFLFRATRHLAHSPPSSTEANAHSPIAALPTAAETAELVGGAVTALASFITATGAAERQPLIGFDFPLPPCLEADGPLPPLAETRIDAARAELRLIGEHRMVLVPMTDRGGMTRTAALWEKGGRWLVDWRSVLTPESMTWDDFRVRLPAEPQLFRVRLVPGTTGTFTAQRPGDPAPPLPVVTPTGTRIAGELAHAVAARGGESLDADVYLAGAAPVRIVGWVPDKWTR